VQNGQETGQLGALHSGQHGGLHNGQDVLSDENVCNARKNISSLVEGSSVTAGIGSFSQSPPSAVDQSQPVLSCSANEPAVSTASATNHLSAQYTQFLASVRDFKPLVADLNASIASIASSVTTMQAGVSSHVPTDTVTASQQYIYSPTHNGSHIPVHNGHHHGHIIHNNGISQSHGKLTSSASTS